MQAVASRKRRITSNQWIDGTTRNWNGTTRKRERGKARVGHELKVGRTFPCFGIFFVVSGRWWVMPGASRLEPKHNGSFYVSAKYDSSRAPKQSEQEKNKQVSGNLDEKYLQLAEKSHKDLIDMAD